MNIADYVIIINCIIKLLSGFIFVRNVWFRFCTKCRASFLYEMSGFSFCTNCRAPTKNQSKSFVDFSITLN